jgi:hypothetical protein
VESNEMVVVAEPEVARVMVEVETAAVAAPGVEVETPMAIVPPPLPPAAPAPPIIPAACVEPPAVVMNEVLEERSAPASEVVRLRDPLVDQLIKTLMEDATTRADAACTGYKALTRKVSDHAARTNRTARGGWSVVGAMMVGMLVGGIWGSYELTRASNAVETLQAQADAGSAAVAECTALRQQLALSKAAVAQARAQAKTAQQAGARAEVELQSYRGRNAPSDPRARQTAYAPSTQPAPSQADAGNGPLLPNP